MKKIYIITAFALILSFSLCGCVYDNTTANINADVPESSCRNWIFQSDFGQAWKDMMISPATK